MDEQPAATRSTGGFDRSRLALALGAAAALVLLVVLGVVLLGDDDDPLDVAGEGPTTTPAPDGTEPEPGPDDGAPDRDGTTTTETAPPPDTPVDPATVLFPDPYSSQRFDDPDNVVRAFARQVIGMGEPEIEMYRERDVRSGEVNVRPAPDGPVSTVRVRQMEDDTWFVTAAVTDELRLDEPSPGEEVSSPIQLSGAARAFEGTVQVRVLADGEGDVGEGFVTGGGDAVRPFEGEVTVDVPDGARYGLVVLVTEAGEELTPWTFTAVRILFT